MKKLSLVVIALCTCATFFCERDTKTRNEGRRGVEPRLSNAAKWEPCRPKAPAIGRVVQESDCEAAIVERPRPCWEVDDPASALLAISSQPHCINVAIDVLQKNARRDAKITSDLAAAFYVRAQRKDEPADLLQALTHANLAVEANPLLPEARFNRALILETLELPDQAITAWNEFLAIAEGGWRQEALERRNRLQSRIPDSRRWDIHRHGIADALRRRDLEQVQQLIEPFPSAAFRHFEDELLPQWANDPTDEHLTQLSLFAEALSRRLTDRFAVDVVRAIERSKDSTALRNAHREYADYRLRRRRLDAPRLASVFARGNSPFHLLVRIRTLEPVAGEVEARRYRYLAALAHWTEGYSLSRSDFISALAPYERARTAFASIHDHEGLVAVHSRVSGVHGVLGNRRPRWREAFYAQRHQDRLIHPNYRTSHYLEIAMAARGWGHDQLALFYLNRNLAEIAKNHDTGNLAITLRHRAQIAMGLGDMDAADRDLARLKALPDSKPIDKDMADWLDARNAELQGQRYLKDEAFEKAIGEFSNALEKMPSIFTTLRALLLSERAEAYEGAREFGASSADRELAVAILQDEGTVLLTHKKLSDEEETWRPYFDRFQDTYRLLIRLLMTETDIPQAFAYAEKARAAEALNLLGRKPATIRELQQELPRDTYLLEYCVVDDERTFLWLIGRERLATFTVAGRRRIEEWSSDLNDAIKDGLTDEFERVVRAAHGALLAEALAQIPRNARIVIVPDGALHALPFGAFLSPEGQYLVERNVIEFSGSAALYLHSLDVDRDIPHSPNPSVLAIGDPAFDETLPFADGLKPLPWGARETSRIRTFYRNSHGWTGREATVPAFLAHAPRYDVIHIAAHAVVNEQEPSNSAILFAQSPGHSGALLPRELLSGLKLDRTHLVILAVCNGIGGTPIGSEGVAPLVRPILAAGTPAVIGSLWNVVDNATTEDLMVSLHAQYAKGRDAATALGEAQRVAIKNKTPVTAWAGFQVIGHASSPFVPRAPARGGNSIDGIHAPNSLQRPDRLRSQ